MPRILGLDAFANALSAHAASYVLIGGAACSVLFDEVGQDFRLTKDLDVVVLADQPEPGFARDLWSFIIEGGYEAGARREGGCVYYRFQLPVGSPNRSALPAQIELFSRHPDFKLVDEDSAVAPLPFDDAVSSLSAIILDDGYYEFIKDGAVMIGGVSTLDALHIIPLKMRAHVDLNRKYAAGVPDGTNDKNLRKHRADVTRLAGLLADADRLPLKEAMLADAKAFFEDYEAYIMRQTNRKQTSALVEALDFLRRVYL